MKLNSDKLTLLENLLHDQFGLHLENQLARYCKAASAIKQRANPKPTSQPIHTPPKPQKSGFISKLKQLLGQ
jgi:hypothetical protein